MYIYIYIYIYIFTVIIVINDVYNEFVSVKIYLLYSKLYISIPEIVKDI